MDGDARTVGEALPWGRRDERERPAIRAAAGPERRATGADHSAGAAPSTVGGGDDLPEAPAVCLNQPVMRAALREDALGSGVPAPLGPRLLGQQRT